MTLTRDELLGALKAAGVKTLTVEYSGEGDDGLCALAARMRFERIEEGLKNVKISFIDSDGGAVLPALEAQLPVQLQANDQIATAQIVTIVSQLMLPSFGEYSIDLAIDGRLEASTPLYVREAPTIPPPSPQKPAQSD